MTLNNSAESTFLIQNALLASRLSKKTGLRLSVHGISLSEYLIMSYLAKALNTAASRIELADHMGMSASGITRLLAPMEKIGLIDKKVNPRDARQSLVMLSAAGTQMYKDANISFEHIATDLLGNLSQEQIANTIESFGQLL